MILCKKSFTLQEGGDMPLDQACYRTPSNSIYGVRGGYIFEFDGTTGALKQSRRFAVGMFSDTQIAYDSGSDRLFAGTWNTLIDWDYAAPAINKAIFKINPTTLAVEATYDPGQVRIGAPFNLFTINGNANYGNVIGGIRGLAASGGYLYFVEAWNNGNPVVGLFRLDIASGLFSVTDSAFAVNFGNPEGGAHMLIDSGHVFIAGSGLGISDVGGFAIADFPWSSTGSDIQSLAGLFTVGGIYYQPYGISVGASSMWVGTISRKVFRLASNLQSAVVIDLGDASDFAYSARYNSIDGLVYVPTYQTNKIKIINPATNGVTTLATSASLDSPFDIVFTPTAKFAVQLGAKGLVKL